MEEIILDIALVSFCIPCYNSAPYLTETLDSILSQDYHNIEVIIVDDHSDDTSLNIIKKIADKDKRVKFESAFNRGAAAARNQAYKLCKGNYIVFFDADDWIPKNFITTQLEALRSNQEVVVAKWGRFYGERIFSITIDHSQIEQDLSFQEWIANYWTNNSHMTCPGRVLMPKNLIEKAGPWDEDLSLNDDFIFYTHIFSNSSLIRFNSNTLFYYRSGINGLSSKKGNLAYLSLYNSIQRSIKVAQTKLKDRNDLNRSYANLLQNFIYETYPFEGKLIEEALQSIKDLGGSDLKFPAGGKTQLIKLVFGWKLAKKIKILTS